MIRRSQTTERRVAAREIKDLTDLFCLLLLRFYRHSGPLGPGVEFGVPAVVRGPVPRARFFCLNQDGQDEQDLQDGSAREDCPKVWKTLMSIDISRLQDDKVREDLNRPRARFCCLNQDVQDEQDEQDDSPSPPKTIGTRVAIAIKVLTDLFS